MDARVTPANPRLGILRQEVEGAVLTPFQWELYTKVSRLLISISSSCYS